jgi:hydroxypyruvate reductase
VRVLAMGGHARRGAAATSGRGGRSTHVAALVGRDLPRGATFAAFATDGVDGSSGTAGAIVDGSFRKRIVSRAGEEAIDDAIARFDTASLHAIAKTALPSRASGHNLADLHVLLVEHD